MRGAPDWSSRCASQLGSRCLGFQLRDVLFLGFRRVAGLWLLDVPCTIRDCMVDSARRDAGSVAAGLRDAASSLGRLASQSVSHVSGVSKLKLAEHVTYSYLILFPMSTC